MSIPKAFFPVLLNFAEFSRKRIKVNLLSKDSASPGDLIQLVMPEGKVSLDSFSLGGLINTTTSAGHATIGNIDQIIEQVMIEVGSIQLHPSFNWYSQVATFMRDLQGDWAKKGYNQILNLQNVAGGDPSANLSNTPFQLNKFLGFLNDVKVLLTDRMPPVRISFRLSQPHVLACAASTTGATYNLTNLYLLVDMLKLSPVYDELISSKIAQSPLQLAYSNYQIIPGVQTGLTNSTRFSSTADALERVYTFPIPTTYQTLNQQVDSVTYSSPAFTRGSSNLLAGYSTRVNINGMSFPDIPAVNERGEVLLQTLQTLGEDHDVTSLPHPNINSLSNWSQHFYVSGTNFSWNDDDSANRKCGLSALGQNLIGSIETLGTSASNAGDVVQPLVVLQTKSVLEVAGNRVCRVIY